MSVLLVCAEGENTQHDKIRNEKTVFFVLVLVLHVLTLNHPTTSPCWWTANIYKNEIKQIAEEKAFRKKNSIREIKKQTITRIELN